MEEDPGWREALSDSWLFVLLPFLYVILLPRTRRKRQTLVGLRTIFLHVVASLIDFLIILRFVEKGGEIRGARAGWFPWLVVASGIYAFAVVRWIRRKRQELTTVDKVAGTYRAAFFIGIGVASTPALFGFTLVFITGAFWLYPFGMAFSLLPLMLVAPTKADVARIQQDIDERGWNVSLVAALSEAGTGKGTQSPSAA